MMQVLPIIVALLLASCALTFVLYPIYRHMSFETAQATQLNVSVNSQADSEQIARSSLQEIELDYQLGNLGETDYRSMHNRYMRRAALAMKSRRDREQELDAMIEEKLRLLKEVERQADE
jgi:hypothetical protein